MRQKGMQRSNQCKRRVIGAKMDQIALQKYQLKRERTKEPLINQLRQ